MIKPTISIKGKINKSIEIKGERNELIPSKGKLNTTIIREKPELENIEITPQAEEQIFKSSKYGFNEVIVKKGVDSSDANAISSDISLGKTAYVNNEKVEGTAEKVDTRDADATPEDLALGKTAYVDNKKIVGVAVSGEYNATIIEEGISNGTRPTSVADAFLLNQMIKKLPDKLDVSFAQGKLYGLFGYCRNVKKFPLITSTGDITLTTQMFVYCDTEDFEIQSFDTSNATSTNDMFGNCKRLTKIPNFNFEKSTNTQSMFSGCNNLLDLSGVSFGQPTLTSRMFNLCTKLKRLPKIDFSKATTFNYIFSGCNNLEDDLNLDLSSCNNASYAFQGCGNKTNNKITLNNTSKVYDWRYAFSSSTGNITLIPDMSACTQIESMFSANTFVETLPINSIGNATSIYCLCYNCKSLKSFPPIDTSKVTRFQRFVDGCESLVDIPVLDMRVSSQGTYIQDMYNGCVSLSNESLNNIMASLLSAVKVTNATYKNLKYIGLSQEQAERCETLSNYQAFVDAGWITGY